MVSDQGCAKPMHACMHACMHASRRPTLASSALPPTRSRRHRQYARPHRTPLARVEQRCYILDTDLLRPNRYRSRRQTTLDSHSETAHSSITAYARTAYAVSSRHTTAAGSSPTVLVFPQSHVPSQHNELAFNSYLIQLGLLHIRPPRSQRQCIKRCFYGTTRSPSKPTQVAPLHRMQTVKSHDSCGTLSLCVIMTDPGGEDRPSSGLLGVEGAPSSSALVAVSQHHKDRAVKDAENVVLAHVTCPGPHRTATIPRRTRWSRRSVLGLQTRG